MWSAICSYLDGVTMTSAYRMGVIGSLIRRRGGAPQPPAGVSMIHIMGKEAATPSDYVPFYAYFADATKWGAPLNAGIGIGCGTPQQLVVNTEITGTTSDSAIGAWSTQIVGTGNMSVGPLLGVWPGGSFPAYDPDFWPKHGTDAFPLTLQMRVKLSSLLNANYIMGAGNISVGGWWALYMETGGTVLKLVEPHLGVDTVTATVTLPTALSTSAFRELAIEMTGTAHRVLRVWLDGVWVGSATSIATPTIVSAGGASLDDRSLRLFRNNTGIQFLGLVDHFRLAPGSFLPAGSDYVLETGPYPY